MKFGLSCINNLNRGTQMKIFIRIVLIAVVASLTACTNSSKYVEVRLYEGSTLYVLGDVTPQFMREGTTETDTNTITPSTDLNLIPIP